MTIFKKYTVWDIKRISQEIKVQLLIIAWDPTIVPSLLQSSTAPWVPPQHFLKALVSGSLVHFVHNLAEYQCSCRWNLHYSGLSVSQSPLPQLPYLSPYLSSLSCYHNQDLDLVIINNCISFIMSLSSILPSDQQFQCSYSLPLIPLLHQLSDLTEVYILLILWTKKEQRASLITQLYQS